jgi:GntR family transcriptional regulator
VRERARAQMANGVDRSSDRPVYRQIADQLRNAITRGEFTPGAKLPSERVLMDRYQTSRVTVRQAIAVLGAEGLIDVEHGRGVFVRSRPPLRRLGRERLGRREREAGKGAFLSDAMAAGREASAEVEVARGVAPPEVAERLHLSQGDQVLIRRRRMLADGQPVQLATSYLPLQLVEGTQIEQADTGTGGTYARLEELGHRLGRFQEDLSARMPLPDEARALRLGAGVPVIRVVRTAFDEQGAPVEVNEMVLAADRYELTYMLPAD